MVTLVIPVRNRASIVERTLQSIANQTYRPLHVVLVDNGSTDCTLDVLSRWQQANQAPDMRIDVISEPQPGACAARNAGIALVDTEWTMHFDSDDVMEPAHVQRALECAAANPQAMVVGWDIYMQAARGGLAVKPFEPRDMMFHCVMHASMATQRYMVRTRLLRRSGLWRPDVAVWNDIELGVRLLRGLKPGQLAKVEGKPTVTQYVSADSITGVNYSGRGPEREHAIDCIEASLPDDQRWIANLKRVVLAADYGKEGQGAMAKRLMDKALGNEPRRVRRVLYRLGYAYARAGLRGAARLLRPLL